MGFNQFLQDVACELQEVLWKDLLRPPVETEWERLETGLHQASAGLAKCRTAWKEARKRLMEQERRARSLETRVRVYLQVADRLNAWRDALELDRIRHALLHDRAWLQRCRQSYQTQLTRVRQLQKLLDTFAVRGYSKG